MINLIVATHGEMSREIVNLTKMVLGESENLEYVTFLPGEGPENLIEKYEGIIERLGKNEGTMFLVDLFGGSPYNAACRVAAENEGMDVITGVNVPMLLELLEARDETENMEELREIAKESGMKGIKSFKEIFAGSANKNDNDDDELEDL